METRNNKVKWSDGRWVQNGVYDGRIGLIPRSRSNIIRRRYHLSAMKPFPKPSRYFAAARHLAFLSVAYAMLTSSLDAASKGDRLLGPTGIMAQASKSHFIVRSVDKGHLPTARS